MQSCSVINMHTAEHGEGEDTEKTQGFNLRYSAQSARHTLCPTWDSVTRLWASVVGMGATRGPAALGCLCQPLFCSSQTQQWVPSAPLVCPCSAV